MGPAFLALGGGAGRRLGDPSLQCQREASDRNQAATSRSRRSCTRRSWERSALDFGGIPGEDIGRFTAAGSVVKARSETGPTL